MNRDETFRGEFIGKLSLFADAETVSIASNILLELMDRYEIHDREKYEIATWEDTNQMYLEMWIGSLKISNHSNATLRAYTLHIQQLMCDVPKQFTDMTANDIRVHLYRYQSTHDIKPVTIENKRLCLCSFFKWLSINEYIQKNPMMQVERVKCQKRVKKAFTNPELSKLRDACSDKKERAIIEFMLSTGCRVGEIVNVTIDNVHLERGEVTVIGKGDKQRLVLLNEITVDRLKSYLDDRNSDSPYLFLNTYGNKYSKETFEHLIHRIGDRAGIAECHPHKFRRTFATGMMNRGVSIQTIQVLLGHESIATTTKYLDITKDGVKIDFMKAST